MPLEVIGISLKFKIESKRYSEFWEYAEKKLRRQSKKDSAFEKGIVSFSAVES